MPKQTAKIFTFPVFPFLVALFPILHVFTSNIGLTGFYTVLPLTCAILLVTATVWFLLNVRLKDKYKSGLLSSVIMLLFLTYGNFYAATDQVTVLGLDMHKHRYVMPACAITIILTWRILKGAGTDTAAKLGKIASVIAVLLLAMPMTNLLSSYWNTTAVATPKADFIIKNRTEAKPKATYPDVYYFILDGYGREDVMQSRLGLDNSSFTRELEKRGFHVAKSSHANYSQTLLSITSSLNMEYLQEMYVPEEQPLSYFREIFKENAVIRNFKDLGYITINTASGYDFTNTLNTDLTISPAHALTEFESAVYSNSILPFLFENDLVMKFTRSTQIDFIRAFLFEQHREKIKLGLEMPRNLPLEPGQPVMAFLHVLIAHQPFVFDANGSPITPEGPFALAMHHNFKSDQDYKSAYIKSYTNQVYFGNKELLQTIDAIQSRKDRKSIIILQGDHGPWSLPNFDDMSKADYAERMSILNALYFPDSTVRTQLYNEISPVNTFRIIFNNYFNAKYELREDKIFFSDNGNRFTYKDITSELLADTLQNTITP